MLPPAGQRSLFITSTAMLLFAAKMYHMHELNDLLKSQVSLDVSVIVSNPTLDEFARKLHTVEFKLPLLSLST